MSGTISSAELYDPATGEWTITGAMCTNRMSNTMTLLPDGKVMVAGGVDYTNRLASAELYDSQTGKWSVTGSMKMAHAGHTAALLSNQEVIVGGGYILAGNNVNPPEVFDPANEAWVTTGDSPSDADNASQKPAKWIVLVGTGDNNVLAIKNTDLYDALAVNAKTPRQP
jgi:hypothetical protein